MQASMLETTRQENQDETGMIASSQNVALIRGYNAASACHGQPLA